MKQYKFHQKDIECNIQYVIKSFAKSIWLKNEYVVAQRFKKPRWRRMAGKIRCTLPP